MGLPTVSIVIPCYNQGPFLGECLASLKSQTYPANLVETIVVDDGSGPDTKETIARLAEHYAFHLITQVNGGLSRARNVGIAYASGDYILPLDADNYLSPDAIELLVATIQDSQVQDPQVMFVYQDKVLFGADEASYVPHQPYNLYRLLSDNFADACSLLDRRVFDWGFAYNETMRQGYEDWELHLRLGLYGYIGRRLKGQTFFYRRWGYSMVNSADREKTQLMAKIQDELASIYFPPHQREIKRNWAPGVNLIASKAIVESQSLLDSTIVSLSDPEHPFAALDLLTAKYLFFSEPDLIEPLNDSALMEKLALTMEMRQEIHAIVLKHGAITLGRFLRSRFVFAELPVHESHSTWNQLDQIIAAKTDVYVWDLDNQTLIVKSQWQAPPERRISRAIKNFGKRHVAPRIGFDTAYQLFYHSYRVFQLSKRALRRRPQTISSQPLEARETGEQLDQGFRHYTDILF